MNNDRLPALAHYVIDGCEPHELGAVKLNKALWFADREAFIAFGRTLTGREYIKLENGPVPRGINAALSELKANGFTSERRVKVIEYARGPRSDRLTGTDTVPAGSSGDDGRGAIRNAGRDVSPNGARDDAQSRGGDRVRASRDGRPRREDLGPSRPARLRPHGRQRTRSAPAAWPRRPRLGQ